MLCDPMWHVGSRSGAVLVAQTAIRFLTLRAVTAVLSNKLSNSALETWPKLPSAGPQCRGRVGMVKKDWICNAHMCFCETYC